MKFALPIGRALLALGASWCLSACGAAPAAPVVAPSSTAVPVGPSLRITGLEKYPEFVTVDAHPWLTVVKISAEGNPEADCSDTATWASTNPEVAVVVPGAAGLMPNQEGTTVITATCGATSAQFTVRVGHYQLSGVVRDQAGVPVAGAEVSVMRLFGFDNEEVTILRTAADGSYSMPSVATRFAMEISKLGFRRSVAQKSWDGKANMVIDAALAATPVVTQGEGKACRYQESDPRFAEFCTAAAAQWDYNTSFSVTTPTTLVFHTDWTRPVGTTGHFYTRLYCGNTIVFDRNDPDPNSQGVTVNAVPSCNYRLYMGNRTSVPVVPYQFYVEVK